MSKKAKVKRTETLKVRPQYKIEKLASNRTRYCTEDVERVISTVIDKVWDNAVKGNGTTTTHSGLLDNECQMVYFRASGQEGFVRYRSVYQRPSYVRVTKLCVETPERRRSKLSAVEQLASFAEEGKLDKEAQDLLLIELCRTLNRTIFCPVNRENLRDESLAALVKAELGPDFRIRVNGRLESEETARRKRRLTTEEKRLKAEAVMLKGTAQRRLNSIGRYLDYYAKRYGELYSVWEEQRGRALALGAEAPKQSEAPIRPEKMAVVVQSRLMRNGKDGGVK